MDLPRKHPLVSSGNAKVDQVSNWPGGSRGSPGLSHYATRHYDPNLGRFTSPDPSGREKSPYLYAEVPRQPHPPNGLFWPPHSSHFQRYPRPDVRSVVGGAESRSPIRSLRDDQSG
ncbi:RHS repeat-associated core domain-containing protein [Streptomyces sp. NPDC008141]|uniref:RHS repeat-associated core domain-containing protein n=1 Tax=Streptomyces sp. NPDC008141 TaxID=3364815 RepID=UPI0036E7A8A2